MDLVIALHTGTTPTDGSMPVTALPIQGTIQSLSLKCSNPHNTLSATLSWTLVSAYN